jgi:hypothetical protein
MEVTAAAMHVATGDVAVTANGSAITGGPRPRPRARVAHLLQRRPPAAMRRVPAKDRAQNAPSGRKASVESEVDVARDVAAGAAGATRTRHTRAVVVTAPTATACLARWAASPRHVLSRSRAMSQLR